MSTSFREMQLRLSAQLRQLSPQPPPATAEPYCYQYQQPPPPPAPTVPVPQQQHHYHHGAWYSSPQGYYQPPPPQRNPYLQPQHSPSTHSGESGPLPTPASYYAPPPQPNHMGFCQLSVGSLAHTGTSQLPATNPSCSPLLSAVPEHKEVPHSGPASALVDEHEKLSQPFSVAVTDKLSLPRRTPVFTQLSRASPKPQCDAVVVSEDSSTDASLAIATKLGNNNNYITTRQSPPIIGEANSTSLSVPIASLDSVVFVKTTAHEKQTYSHSVVNLDDVLDKPAESSYQGKVSMVEAKPSRGSTGSDVSDESSSSSLSNNMHKPHKANDGRWEAIQAVRDHDGMLGLNHFRLVKRLGCGDIGSVYLSELSSTSTCFAMKVMDKAPLDLIHDSCQLLIASGTPQPIASVPQLGSFDMVHKRTTSGLLVIALSLLKVLLSEIFRLETAVTNQAPIVHWVPCCLLLCTCKLEVHTLAGFLNTWFISHLFCLPLEHRFEKGRKCHGLVVKIVLEENVYVGNALLCMYAKCGVMRDAMQVFGEMAEPNEVTFTAMMGGLKQTDRVVEALEMFRLTCRKGMRVDNLNHFSSYFRRYQQEDAHEFLQCFLDKLERSWLDSEKNNENSSCKDKNLVSRVSGGSLISKLRCCSCGHCSDTREPLIDLSLEIEDAGSLPRALESFTKIEKINDSDTKFTCENCKEEVSVEKQLVLDEAPPVAAFHLKRFKTDGNYVEKIDKHVEFPLELDLKPYTSGNNSDVELKYELYAIVEHVGFSATSGHYFCFIRSAPNTWHRLDDSKVTRVREEFVLSQEAYILFYARQGTPWFSSLKEGQMSGSDLHIMNTSPKSVLDNVEDTVPVNIPVGCIPNPPRDVGQKISTFFRISKREEVLVTDTDMPLMQFCDFEPDDITYINLLAACVKSGDIKSGCHMFDNISNVISRNAILSGYFQIEDHKEVIKLFREMQFQGVKSDRYTLAIAPSSSAAMGILEAGKEIHAASCKIASDTDMLVCKWLFGFQFSRMVHLSDSIAATGMKIHFLLLIACYGAIGLVLAISLAYEPVEKPQCVKTLILNVKLEDKFH